MSTSGARRFRLTERCHRCQGPIGPKHRETCPGPMQRIADPPVRDDPHCDCGPGPHQYPCEVAYWPPGWGERA